MKLDFNSTSFSHPLSGDQSLSSRDKAVRDFWIEHTIRSRKIADEMGRQLNDKACHNLRIHDGSKDLTVDRYLYRSLLTDSLDKIFATKLRVVGPLLPAPRTARRVEEHAVGSRVRLLLPEKQRSGSRGLHRYDRAVRKRGNLEALVPLIGHIPRVVESVVRTDQRFRPVLQQGYLN